MGSVLFPYEEVCSLFRNHQNRCVNVSIGIVGITDASTIRRQSVHSEVGIDDGVFRDAHLTRATRVVCTFELSSHSKNSSSL